MLPVLATLALLAIFGFALYSAFTAPSLIRRIIHGVISVWVVAFLYAVTYYSPLGPPLLLPLRLVIIAAVIALALSFMFEKKKG